MSGWDVSSTPTWGPQDGPEDTQAFTAPGDSSRDFGTQDFGAQDFGRSGPNSPAGSFPESGAGFGDGQAGGPPPEFFGQDYGQDQHLDLGPSGYPQRTPGRSLQNLPRRESRGRHGGAAPGGGYGQENGYGGQDAGYGQEPAAYGQEPAGYGQEPAAYGQEPAAYGQEPAGYGQEPGAYGQEAPYGQDAAFGQETAYGQEPGYGQETAAYGQETSYGQEPGAYGQEASYGQDGAFGQEWGGAAPDQASPWAGGGRDNGRGNGRDNDGGWGRTEGRSAAPWDDRPQQDPGYGDADGFGRQDYGRQPESLGFSAQDYAGQDIPGQQGLGQPGLGTQEPPGFGRMDRESAARNDPALQDFFAPSRGGGGGFNQGPTWSGSEQRDQARDEPRERFTQAPADWANPGRSSAPRTGTGPRPMPRGPRRDAPEPKRGLGMKGIIAIVVVVIIVIVVAVVLLTHKSGGSPSASNTPAGGTATTPAAQPTASKAGGSGTGKTTGGSGTTTPAYTLSTPSTAGGYPIGQDPNFLTAATATAQQVSTAVTSGGGGTVTGKAVSAAYQIPAQQVITFVGYQGSFTPAKVATILASLGSDSHVYPAGTLGGILGCANTTTAPDGAVCVWADSSTLGITEFFEASGPETLTPGTEQAKGGSDTVSIRDDVEKKAS
jgi:hypothetical protein